MGDCHQKASQPDTQGLRGLMPGSSNLPTRKLQKNTDSVGVYLVFWGVCILYLEYNVFSVYSIPPSKLIEHNYKQA